MGRAKAAPAAIAEEAFVPDALVIRTCDPGGKSHSGYTWPMTVGEIAACPDWDAKAECGNGLHGLLDGIGDWSLTARDNAVWQVVGVKRSECVSIDGDKVKFPRGRVEYVGGFAGAMLMIQKAMVSKLLEMAEGNAATGYSGHAAATGDSGHAAATGKFGIAASLGWNGSAEAGADGAIVLAYWDDRGDLKRVFSSMVGENGIEAGKTYLLGADGKPVEA